MPAKRKTHSALRTPHLFAAFTLVELLVVISIIGLLASWARAGQSASHPPTAAQIAEAQRRAAAILATMPKPAELPSITQIVPMPTTLPTTAQWEAYREFAIKQWAKRSETFHARIVNQRAFLRAILDSKIDSNLSQESKGERPTATRPYSIFTYKTSQAKEYGIKLHTREIERSEQCLLKELSHLGVDNDPAWWSPKLHNYDTGSRLKLTVGLIGRLDEEWISPIRADVDKDRLIVRSSTGPVIIEGASVLYVFRETVYDRRMLNYRPGKTPAVNSRKLSEFLRNDVKRVPVLLDGVWYVFGVENDAPRIVRLPDDMLEIRRYTPATLPATMPAN